MNRVRRVVAALGMAALLASVLGLGTASASTGSADTGTSSVIRGKNAIGVYTIQATFTVVTATSTTTTVVRPDGHGDTPNQAPGCGYYHRWINQYDLFDAVLLYTYNHQLNWCWDGVRTSHPHVYYWATLHDPTSEYYGQVSGYPFDFYYNYSGRNSLSGYASRTQGHFGTGCVPAIGCIGNGYPAVNLYGHYNGSLHWSDQS